MVNKYIRHGETYCGDGTTSAAATSNGGVGAWNNINVFQGTTPAYGVLAAGDVVYIRSKDQAGVDIAVSVSGAALYLGAAAATELTPIKWVIDVDAVWSGISGTVTFTMTSNNIIYTRDYNNIDAGDHKLICVHAYASFINAEYMQLGKSQTRGIKVDNTAQIASYGGHLTIAEGTHADLYVVTKNGYDAVIMHAGYLNDVVLINPILECLTPSNASYANALFNSGSNYGGSFTIFGGEAFGAGLHDARVLYRGDSNVGANSFYGFKYPRNVAIASQATLSSRSYIFANGGDGGVGNAYWDYYYAYDSRDDGYYPTLGAQLETSSADGWSYKIYPHRTTKQKPARVPVSKMYTQTAAAKIITLELLWPTGMAAPTKDLVYITVGYTDDATGLKKTIGTLDPAGGTLDTSTSAWSATTYGATLFTKYKLSVTTPTSVKQDTEVMMVLLSAPRSASVTDILFVDPDFALI